MMTPLYWYLLLVLVIAAQRIWELGRSKRNTQALMERGAIEIGAQHYPVMAALHTTWLFACVAEAFSQNTAPPLSMVLGAMALLVMGQSLRLIAMATLGERWTTRIIVLPRTDVVSTGIFRHIRHPNYLGVILEIAALPLVFGGWKTALGFSIANGLLLWVRIRAEEAALSDEGDYRLRFDGRNRFIPTGRNS